MMDRMIPLRNGGDMAKTNAERQAAFRARRDAKINALVDWHNDTQTSDRPTEDLVAEIQSLVAQVNRLLAERSELKEDNQQLFNRVLNLQAHNKGLNTQIGNLKAERDAYKSALADRMTDNSD